MTPVSPGVATGRVARIATEAPFSTRWVGGSPADRAMACEPTAEAARLADACASVAAELRVAAQALSAEAGAVLAALADLVGDPAVQAEAAPHLARGAAGAFNAVAAAEIAAAEAANHPVLRAKAADWRDLAARVAQALGEGAAPAPPPGAVLVGPDLPPTRLAGWQPAALVLETGDPLGHAAVIARALGIPMVIGEAADLADGDLVQVDGTAGTVERLTAHPAITAPPVAPMAPVPPVAGGVTLLATLSRPEELVGWHATGKLPVGLLRTELWFAGEVPAEADQHAAYAALLAAAGEAPVTIRLFDAAPDKPVTGLPPGLDGVAALLARPAVLETQLCALATLARPVSVLVPRLMTLDQWQAVEAALARVLARLAAEGRRHHPPTLAAMIETPDALDLPARLPPVPLSIGTNDLARLLPDPSALLPALRHVLAHGVSRGQPVTVCGEAALPQLDALVSAGVTRLSCAPRHLPGMAARLRHCAGPP